MQILIKLTKISLCCLGFLLLSIQSVQAEEVNVAASSDFRFLKEKLSKLFEEATGHKATITTDAAGLMYKRIKDGEPFDIFLSADVKMPKSLEEDGLGVANTRFTAAIGKLVVWSPKPGLVDGKGEILNTGDFTHIASANPDIAPYGVASREAMKRFGVWDKLQPKLILSKSSDQAYEFTVEGKAELCFTSLSVLNPMKKIAGSFWIIPKNLYDPLEQQAILLKRAEQNKAAQAFMEFLKTPRARTIIENYGYSVPN